MYRHSDDEYGVGPKPKRWREHVTWQRVVFVVGYSLALVWWFVADQAGWLA